MNAQAWEPRVSRLEGAFEQISDRLNSMDRRMEHVEDKIDGLDRKIGGNFRALIGWMLGQTVVVVGAMVAVAFALHR